MTPGVKIAGDSARQFDGSAEPIEIHRLRRDGGTQARLSLNQQLVRQYSSLMAQGVVFPPIRAWFDGAYYWVSDGFHRVAAAELLRYETVAAVILNGSLEDARWDSYRANGSHGLRYSRADLHHLISKALAHPNARQLSSNQLAIELGIPEVTLRRWRTRLSSSLGEDAIRMARRGGKSYVIRTNNIGRSSLRTASVPRSIRDCRTGLREMKQMAPPETAALLSTLDSWLTGKISATVCLEGLNDLIKCFK
jgi:hypothetical protein